MERQYTNILQKCIGNSINDSDEAHSIISEDIEYFQVLIMDKKGYIPKKQTDSSAGYDIQSAETIIVKPNSRVLISTCLKISPPEDCYIRLAPRSGLSVKGMDIAAGVIDADYRGEIKVLFVNTTDNDFIVNRGDRIAQMIFEKYKSPICMIVDELSQTQRGEGGFGHTGK